MGIKDLDWEIYSVGDENLGWRRYTQLGMTGSARQFGLAGEYILSWGNNSVGEVNPIEEVNSLLGRDLLGFSWGESCQEVETLAGDHPV